MSSNPMRGRRRGTLASGKIAHHTYEVTADGSPLGPPDPETARSPDGTERFTVEDPAETLGIGVHAREAGRYELCFESGGHSGAGGDRDDDADGTRHHACARPQPAIRTAFSPAGSVACMRVREGGLAFDVPEQPDAGVGDAVFYNPTQELNRDVTVAVLRALLDGAGPDLAPNCSYLDATAATGVRGVRAAAEGYDATLCDRDPDAVQHCEANLAA